MKCTMDVLVSHKPETVIAQQETVLLLSPVDSKTNNNTLDLEPVHTKDIHLIIVSEDLSYFAHEHPEKHEKQYKSSFAFPFAGKFLLYLDIKPQNDSPVVIRKTVEVNGEKRQVQSYQRNVLSSTAGDVTAELDIKDLSAMKVKITQGSTVVPATSLGEFLGAKAHVVMINLETKEYLHVLPMVHQDVLQLHSAFTTKGLYRVWVQFILNERLYTMDYALHITAVPKSEGHHH